MSSSAASSKLAKRTASGGSKAASVGTQEACVEKAMAPHHQPSANLTAAVQAPCGPHVIVHIPQRGAYICIRHQRCRRSLSRKNFVDSCAGTTLILKTPVTVIAGESAGGGNPFSWLMPVSWTSLRKVLSVGLVRQSGCRRRLAVIQGMGWDGQTMRKILEPTK